MENKPTKPRLKRYFAAYNDGWSFVVAQPGEWVWAYFYTKHGELDVRPTVIARALGTLLAWVAPR